MTTSYKYIDSLKELLSSLDVNLTLNDDLLLNYINQARSDTQRLTMRLYPERYGDIYFTNITPLTPIESNIGYNRNFNATVYQITLPTDFIDIYECIFKWNLDKAFKVQGRKIIKQELYSILSHKWLGGQMESPVYCEEVISGTKYLYVSGFDRQAPKTLLNDLTTPYIGVEIYYLKALDDLEKYVAGAADIDWIIPETFQNMVTDIAAIYALNTNPIKESLETMIQSKMKDIGITYETGKLKAEELLPTHNNP